MIKLSGMFAFLYASRKKLVSMHRPTVTSTDGWAEDQREKSHD
jgi:hypothetical protein